MDYKERLLVELLELARRTEILKRTLESESCPNNTQQVDLLRQQYEAMSKYEEILYIRVLQEMK